MNRSAKHAVTGLTEGLKPGGGPLLHSKLHIIYEKGDKSRIIAMADYWSQDALTPLHNALFRILKEIDVDFTHDQEAGFAHTLRLANSDVGSLYSLDLSAATDRLPVWFQASILSYLRGNKEYGHA